MDWTFGLGIGLLVWIAFVFDLFGFIARDELILRGLMLVASGFYLVYYFFVAGTPLWDALATNGALAAVNLAMIVVVIAERTTFTMSRETRDIYAHFPVFTPGQFRRLLRAAEDVRMTAPREVTRQDAPVERVWFLLAGGAEIDKNGHRARMAPGQFIGEMGFLSRRPASATVTLSPGARALAWDVDALERLLDRKPALRVALGAQFNIDLVEKLARARPGDAPV